MRKHEQVRIPLCTLCTATTTLRWRQAWQVHKCSASGVFHGTDFRRSILRETRTFPWISMSVEVAPKGHITSHTRKFYGPLISQEWRHRLALTETNFYTQLSSMLRDEMCLELSWPNSIALIFATGYKRQITSWTRADIIWEVENCYTNALQMHSDILHTKHFCCL